MNRHMRLQQLTSTQQYWWTMSNALGDILEKRNTPIGSVIFAWPTRSDAERWRDHLIRNHGAPLAGWEASRVEYSFMENFLISGGYNALILGELPGEVGLTLQNMRA